ncbi:hydantoinase/oxoprolinase family protein [Candidatus Thorarchaeota archaeon]|nr:MAG: hydantoinase/oxoprolinase family protein [Candidatus Thorarchaeota archaeon]
MNVIGVDVGGTFTDVILYVSETNATRVHKVPSTPEAQERAVIKAIREVLEESNLEGRDIDLIVHGTTVATNAMLERKGADVWLITTQGLEDVIEIGRQNRRDIYDMRAQRTEPLVPRNRRIGVNERVTSEGEVITPLENDEIDSIVEMLESRGPQAIAISLLYSFKWPEHEARIMDALRKSCKAYTVASSQVLPEFREFERTSTTVLEAYLGPLVLGYLTRLGAEVRKVCPKARLTVIQSNGGTLLSTHAEGKAVGLAISGLAGGVIGGWDIAQSASLERALTLDMGGTSCDISAVVGGVTIRADNEVGGLPLRTPSVDVKTIGAGGGSIAWVDEVGVLHVGPQSAGAMPGPAAYGKGGTHTTLTDANLFLGRLNPYYFLGGGLSLDPDLAKRAVSNVAKSLGVSLERAALGIIRVSTANMVQAIREVTIERGYDPRQFTLVPFGGAGPTQAVDIAESIGIDSILVPPHPGITSAYGLVCADLRVDVMRSVLVSEDGDNTDIISTALYNLTEDAKLELVEQGADPPSIDYEWELDMRYQGQSHELKVSIPPYAEEVVDESIRRFHVQHKMAFGYALLDTPIEWVTARVVGRLPHAESILHRYQRQSTGIPPRTRNVILEGGKETAVEVFRREELSVDQQIRGPSVIEQTDTTTYIGPDWIGTQRRNGNLTLRRAER